MCKQDEQEMEEDREEDEDEGEDVAVDVDVDEDEEDEDRREEWTDDRGTWSVACHLLMANFQWGCTLCSRKTTLIWFSPLTVSTLPWPWPTWVRHDLEI